MYFVSFSTFCSLGSNIWSLLTELLKLNKLFLSNLITLLLRWKKILKIRCGLTSIFLVLANLSELYVMALSQSVHKLTT